MFTGSNATVIRRMQSADEIAMQTAVRLHRDLQESSAVPVVSLPIRKPAQRIPSTFFVP